MAAEIIFRRAYAVEVDEEIIGFVRGPDRWDGYHLQAGLVAVAQTSRASAAEQVLEAHQQLQR